MTTAAGLRVNQAIIYRDFGCPRQVLRLEEKELPPLESDFRVEMLIAPVNPSDLIPVRGAYAHRVRPPKVAGYEGVGRIVQVRSNSDSHLVGQRVLPLRSSGTWQRYVDCGREWTIQVPDLIPDHLAARAYINPLTALLMAKRWHSRGKTVVLTAASSTCGALLGRLCLDQGAAEVVGIYRTASHEKRLRAIGMVPVLESRLGEVLAKMVDAGLIFDAVGGAQAGLLAAMAPEATFVSYGNLSGSAGTGLGQFPDFHQFRLLDAIAAVTPDIWQRWFTEVWTVLQSSALPPLEVFALASWLASIETFEQAGRTSKPAIAFSPVAEESPLAESRSGLGSISSLTTAG